MDRILLATDFSTRSDRALRRATLIARRVGATLTLLHVVDADRPKELVETHRAAALTVLQKTAETLRTEDGINADQLLRVDDVHSGILRAAEETRADLVILGPHRARLRDVFVGTTVERVVRRSRFPLLVACQSPSASYERTLLAVDFDEASTSAAHAALAMGIFEHTEVIVMHAFDTPAEGQLRRAMETKDAITDYVSGERNRAAERLGDLVRELRIQPSRQVSVAITGTPARTIIESAKSHDAHLIVLGTNQRKGWERLLIGSVTEAVIRNAHLDVLIVPVDKG